MAVSLISVKCPDCGATLNIEEDRKQAFCTYCGAKILINNENEHIYRHINEAKVKRAETERMQAETERVIRLKQMELEEKQRAADEKIMMLKIIVSLALFIVGLLMMVIGGGSRRCKRRQGFCILYDKLYWLFPLGGRGAYLGASITGRR